jgi:hypothetical protein
MPLVSDVPVRTACEACTDFLHQSLGSAPTSPASKFIVFTVRNTADETVPNAWVVRAVELYTRTQ